MAINHDTERAAFVRLRFNRRLKMTVRTNREQPASRMPIRQALGVFVTQERKSTKADPPRKKAPNIFQPVGLVWISVRLRPEITRALKRTSLERQLAGAGFFSQQKIVERSLAAWLSEHGGANFVSQQCILIADGSGGTKRNPAYTISANAQAKVRAFENDPGLNHLSRQRWQALPEAEQTPRMRLDRKLKEKYLGA